MESPAPAIQNDSYVYKLAGESNDTGSGVERVVFYYMRKAGKTKETLTNGEMILDPLIDISGSDYAPAKVAMPGSFDPVADGGIDRLEITQDSKTYYLYAYKVAGSTTAGTFTAKEKTLDAHVRTGGLIYIDGLYRKITAKTATTATFEPALTEAKDDITAWFPIAQVIDTQISEKTSDTAAHPFVFEDNKDDGDLMPESFNKISDTWYWDASIHSDNLPDGPISLVILAFDEAGNVNGTTINTKVTNNAPRLAKLFLATDLNSNDMFENEEFEVYNIVGKTGQEQAAYELDFESFGQEYGSGIFTAKNKLAVVPELVGGNGAITLVAKKDARSKAPVTSAAGTSVSAIASATAADTSAMSLTKIGSPSYEVTADIFEAAKAGNNFYAYVLTNNQLTGKDSPTESDDGTNKPFSFTFWDSTEETTSGTDSQNSVLWVKNFTFDLVDGIAPTVVVNPFYWKTLNSNSIYESDKINSDESYAVSSTGDLQGHIELEADWKTTKAYTDNEAAAENEKNSQYDGDPKVSGKITFTGTAYDEHALKSLAFSFGKEGNYRFKNETLTEYDTATGKWSNTAAWKTANPDSVKTMAANGYEVTIVEDAGNEYGVYEDSVYFGQSGHKIYWTLSIDTEKITGIAATDMVLTVLATDLAGQPTSTDVTAPVVSDDYIPASTTGSRTVTDGTTNVPSYQMDIVPYVTKVYTKLAKSKPSNWSVYNRTALGHYPVQSVVSNIDNSITLKTSTSEDVVLYGFNINDASATITSGDQIFTVEKTDALKIDNNTAGQLGFNVAKLYSGQLNLTVSGLAALNNVNNNNAKGAARVDGTAYANCYNRQPNGDTNNILTDDVEFDVWEFNDRAATPINGLATGINMEVNQKTGMLNYAFANGGVYYSMGGNINKTNAYDDENSYSSYYWAGDYDTFAGPCVGFHIDDLGYTYSVDSGGDTNTGGSVDKWVLYSSRWGILGRDYYGTLNGNYSLRLEEIGLRTGTDNLNYSLMKYRFLSPEFASTVSDESTNLYLVYYDALCNQIRFRAGTFNTTAKQTSGGFQDEYQSGVSQYYKTNNCQIIANGESDPFKTSNTATVTIPQIAGRGAGQYVDVAVVKNDAGNDVVCVVWYDMVANNLKFSHITDPIASWDSLKGDITAKNWSTPKTIFSEGGEYCHIAADKDNHLHIAAYAGNGDVMYAYLDSYTSTAVTATVDNSGSVGEHLTLDVAVNSAGHSIPYIGYYTGAIKKPKYAYLVDPTLEDSTATFTQAADGADSNERFTGAWEVVTVPTPSAMTTNREDKVNVGVWKNAGVIKKSTNGTSSKYNKVSGYGSENWSKTWGNGTANGILGYQVVTGTGSGLETAQMRERK